MATKALTLRVDARTRAALSELSKVTSRPVNKLVNEAIQRYLDTAGQAVEQQLEDRLRRLRALRKRDPDLRLAFEEFAAAEASLSEDPVEGTIIELANPRKVAESGENKDQVSKEVRSAIRSIIDG